MNFRQRYKRAKQKIALLERQKIALLERQKNAAYIVQDKPIIPCVCWKSVEPWEMEHSEIIMKELRQEMLEQISKYVRIEGTLDAMTGKFVICAMLRVVDGRFEL